MFTAGGDENQTGDDAIILFGLLDVDLAKTIQPLRKRRRKRFGHMLHHNNTMHGARQSGQYIFKRLGAASGCAYGDYPVGGIAYHGGWKPVSITASAFSLGRISERISACGKGFGARAGGAFDGVSQQGFRILQKAF